MYLFLSIFIIYTFFLKHNNNTSVFNVKKQHKRMNIFWYDWQYSALAAWIELILHSLLCVIIIILLCIYMRIFCCKSNNNQSKSTNSNEPDSPSMTSSSTRARTISTNSKHKCFDAEIAFDLMLLISILLCVIVVLSLYYVGVLSILILDMRYSNHCFYRILCTSPIYIQRGVVFVFFLHRLNITFTGSIFAMNKIHFRILVTLSIGSVPVLYAFILYFAFIDTDFYCKNSKPLLVSAGVASGWDVMMSLTITYLFISKLKQLVALQNGHVNIKLQKITKKLTILS